MLPNQDRPLRWLFLDLNSYFASVEQAEDVSLLGKPVAVAPVSGDGATIIAASYEAKAFGVSTGTKVGEAKRLCPDIIFKPARPSLYVHYHKMILNAVETVLPIHRVCSIDEMKFRLLGSEMEEANARILAERLKSAIKAEVAPSLTCSIGIAPNSFLAKLASDLQKPDGLVVIEAKDLPDRLRGLKLTTFTGINRRMEARLMASGIFVSDDLLSRSPKELVRAFGSKVGERWWHLLRGDDQEFENETGKSLGHSNVLAPQYRNDEGCREIMLRLIHKACARMRANAVWAGHVHFSVLGREKSWSADTRIAPTQDAITVMQHLQRFWPDRDFKQPTQVGVTFTDLRKSEAITQ